jgi:hypothetical protein
MPPKAEATYYNIIGVEPTASPEEITKAYRQQASKLHPDKDLANPNATSNFQELGDAYETLIDPSRKARYDEATFGTSILQGFVKFRPTTMPVWQQNSSLYRNMVGAEPDGRRAVFDKMVKWISEDYYEGVQAEWIDDLCHALALLRKSEVRDRHHSLIERTGQFKMESARSEAICNLFIGVPKHGDPSERLMVFDKIVKLANETTFFGTLKIKDEPYRGQMISAATSVLPFLGPLSERRKRCDLLGQMLNKIKMRPERDDRVGQAVFDVVTANAKILEEESRQLIATGGTQQEGLSHSAGGSGPAGSMGPAAQQAATLRDRFANVVTTLSRRA